MWSDATTGVHYGKTRPHGMNIKVGEANSGVDGLSCVTCHAETNSPVLHGPPGAPHWAAAPREMGWVGKSSGEICAQIKDRTRTGGKECRQSSNMFGMMNSSTGVGNQVRAGKLRLIPQMKRLRRLKHGWLKDCHAQHLEPAS